MQLNPMFGAFLGGMEIVLVFAVVFLLFGAKKLPELAKGLGTGIREFKKATKGVTDEIQNAVVEKQIAPAVSQSPNQTATSKDEI